MDKTKQFLSDLVINTKYAKYLPEKGRREVWDEIVHRTWKMHDLQGQGLGVDFEDIKKAFQLVKDKTIMPSMRSLQFSGEPIRRANHRIYNCSYLPIREVLDFSELFYMLLLGCGVGYSVRQRHIEQLPEVWLPGFWLDLKKHVIEDSIEGWANAIKFLFNGWLGEGYRCVFDYSKIRPKGERLKTSGGYAPGPEGLKKAIENINTILWRRQGEFLRSIDVHDIICHLANAVMSGGNRRSAMLCIFDYNDEDMLSCKQGEYWKDNEQRGRANNSVLIPRNLDYNKFKKLFDATIVNGTGEPGFIWVDSLDTDNGYNPCVEAGLEPYQCCNCVTINATQFTEDNASEVLKYAALIGTLQASYMITPYLSNRWYKALKEACLLGVSFTGIKDVEDSDMFTTDVFSRADLDSMARVIKNCNREYSKQLNINRAHRCTFIKPEGTTSLVCGTSSGLHYYYAPYYIRRVRVNNEFAIVKYMYENYPEFIEPELFRSEYESVISVPIKGNDKETEHINKIQHCTVAGGVALEHIIQQLEEIGTWNSWLQGSYRKGPKHNVSYTLKYKKPEVLVEEFFDLFCSKLYEYRFVYSGISIFQEDTTVYKQLPHEEITEEVYNKMYERFPIIDFSKLLENHDCDLHLRDNAACVGDICDI